MELSRRVLGCLELFRGRYFDDDEAIRSYLLDSIQSIKQTTNCILCIYWNHLQQFNIMMNLKKKCVCMVFVFYYCKQQSMDCITMN